jgi:RHH-type rel operon transcriptional repressor/antitoxin RelB
MLALRLPSDVEERLTNLAKKTGRTKTFYATRAVIEYLEDLEDYYLAEDAYQEYVADGKKSYSWDEVKREHELSNKTV